MPKGFRTVIKDNNTETDVSGRKIILYGIGAGCKYLKPQLFFDVAYVLDGDKSKQGRKVVFYDHEYTVVSPDILSSLSPDDYYIVVTALSNSAISSIRLSINENGGGRPFLIAYHVFDYGRSNLFFWYDDMQTMLLADANMRMRVGLCYVPAFQLIYADWFREAVKKTFGIDQVEDGICPVRLGYGIVFLFRVKGVKYVFKIPKTQRWIDLGDYKDSELGQSVLETGLDSIKKLTSEVSELTIFESTNGCQIQKAGISGDELQWKEENIETVIHLIKKLHRKELVVSRKPDIMEFVDRPRNALSAIKDAPWSENLALIEKKAICYYEQYNKMVHSLVLSHGDLGTYNIVIYGSRVFFIDWEGVAMLDPFYDICKFLNTTDLSPETLRNRFKYYLNVYLDRECTDEEYERACLLLKISAWFELLFEIEKLPQLEHKDYINDVLLLYDMMR